MDNDLHNKDVNSEHEALKNRIYGMGKPFKLISPSRVSYCRAAFGRLLRCLGENSQYAITPSLCFDEATMGAARGEGTLAKGPPVWERS